MCSAARPAAETAAEAAEARAEAAEARAEEAEAAAAEKEAVVARLQRRMQEALAAAEATRRTAEEVAAVEATQLRGKLATAEARAVEAEAAAAEAAAAEAETAARHEARATYAGLAAAAAAEEGEVSTRRPSFFSKLLGCTAGVPNRGGVYAATPARSPTGNRSGAAEQQSGVALGGTPPLAEVLVEVGSTMRDSSSVEESSEGSRVV